MVNKPGSLSIVPGDMLLQSSGTDGRSDGYPKPFIVQYVQRITASVGVVPSMALRGTWFSGVPLLLSPQNVIRFHFSKTAHRSMVL